MFSDSTLGVLLKALPRDEIAKLVDRHGSDKWRKSFTTWDHLVAMLTAQFSGVTSLRELEAVLADQDHHHYHLGFQGVKRSTLSDSNKSRTPAVFRDLLQVMIRRSGRQSDELNKLLTVLDASNIRLAGKGYEWAEKTRTRTTCFGLKLHVRMDHSSEMLEDASITPTNVNDLTAGKDFELERGRVYVFDKGYCDYNWWLKIMENGSHFVTRLKVNAAYKVSQSRQISDKSQGHILQDQVVELTNRYPKAKKTSHLVGKPLRLVQIKHPGGKSRPFLIVCSDLTASAEQIASWYKQRWSIELLFKWVKQNLKIKRFMGQSRNAVMIQIYVALIAYILLKLYKKMQANSTALRLKDVVITLRTRLFERAEMFQKRQKHRHKTFQNQHELWGFPS